MSMAMGLISGLSVRMSSIPIANNPVLLGTDGKRYSRYSASADPPATKRAICGAKVLGTAELRGCCVSSGADARQDGLLPCRSQLREERLQHGGPIRFRVIVKHDDLDTPLG